MEANNVSCPLRQGLQQSVRVPRPGIVRGAGPLDHWTKRVGGLVKGRVAVSMRHNGRQMTSLPKRLGFFTRLLDQADAAERYRLALAQIMHAERLRVCQGPVAAHPLPQRP